MPRANPGSLRREVPGRILALRVGGSSLEPHGCGGQTVLVSFWLVGEFTTHFRFLFVGTGMFTGGTIWILSHGHMVLVSKRPVRAASLPGVRRRALEPKLASRAERVEPKQLLVRAGNEGMNVFP